MKLSDMPTGSSAVVVKILGHGAFRKRVMEMGFLKGREVNILLQAPLNDPVKYSIMGYEVSLRRSEAALIEVEPLDMKATELQDPSMPEGACPEIKKPKGAAVINVALIGNPNCGKTSLFNVASGASEHVGDRKSVV